MTAGVLALVVAGPMVASAQDYGGQSQGGDSWSGYQRKSSHDNSWHGDRKHDRFRSFGPNVSAGSFQRPYPYHLDYYRMKYGGSYAPYFGNLYGPPTFVGVPFWGNGTFFPSYGFNGFPPGGVGYPSGFDGGPGPGYPNGGGCVGPGCPEAGEYSNGPLPAGVVEEVPPPVGP